MRRLTGVYGNGFEVSFVPMQRVFFFKLGFMAWGVRMKVGRSHKAPQKCMQNLCMHRYVILRLCPFHMF